MLRRGFALGADFTRNTPVCRIVERRGERHFAHALHDASFRGEVDPVVLRVDADEFVIHHRDRADFLAGNTVQNAHHVALIQRVNTMFRAGYELADSRREPFRVGGFSVTARFRIEAVHSGKGRDDKQIIVDVNRSVFNDLTSREAPQQFPARFTQSIHETFERAREHDSGIVRVGRVVRFVGHRANAFTHGRNIVTFSNTTLVVQTDLAERNQLAPGWPGDEFSSVTAAGRDRRNLQRADRTNTLRLLVGFNETQ